MCKVEITLPPAPEKLSSQPSCSLDKDQPYSPLPFDDIVELHPYEDSEYWLKDAELMECAQEFRKLDLEANVTHEQLLGSSLRTLLFKDNNQKQLTPVRFRVLVSKSSCTWRRIANTLYGSISLKAHIFRSDIPLWTLQMNAEVFSNCSSELENFVRAVLSSSKTHNFTIRRDTQKSRLVGTLRDRCRRSKMAKKSPRRHCGFHVGAGSDQAFLYVRISDLKAEPIFP